VSKYDEIATECTAGKSLIR